MALVPFIALIFAVGRIFHFQKVFEKDLVQRFSEQKELINELIQFANNLLMQSKGGIIALIGVIFLFTSLIQLLSHIESTFNNIWKVKRRKLKHSLNVYISFILMLPILILTYSLIKVFFIDVFVEKYVIDSVKEWVFYIFLIIAPYVLIYVIFCFVYLLMPNTRVKFKYAFYGALISGTFYQFLQYFYILFQSNFTKFNAIYGSFAALPLFLIWLQLSWLIFLFGAELTYSFQNLKECKFK